MISKMQAEYAQHRYAVQLPTWLDANDMGCGIPALARAVAAGLQQGIQMRAGVASLIRLHQKTLAEAAELLAAREVTEDPDERKSVPSALRALAEHEERLAPLVQALHEATDEPHL
jgi:hypothetical protein